MIYYDHLSVRRQAGNCLPDFRKKSTRYRAIDITINTKNTMIILYLSPLFDMSPATSDCLEQPHFSGFFLFFFNYRVCVC